MADYPSVTVVIPNYNGQALLRRNLPAVLRAGKVYPGCCKVIVVDDASTEPGLDALMAEFPPVTWLRHEANQGFGGSIATGVAAAPSEVVVLLNSDVAPAEDYLAPLIHALVLPHVFAVSPLIVDDAGDPMAVSWNRYRFTGGRLRREPWKLEDAVAVPGPRPTLFSSGGSMAVYRSHFLALGGFPELYHPFYVEDLDLGVQAWRHGWRVLFEPRSQVVHQRDGSIKTQVARARVKRTQRRNGLWFEWAHYSLWRIGLYRSPRIVKQLIGRTLRGDRDYLAGFASALFGWRRAVRHRRHVQTISTVDFEAVLARVWEHAD